MFGTLSDMGNVLVKSAVVDVGIQWAGFVLAAAFRTEKFFDFAGTLLAIAYNYKYWL